VNYYNEWDSFAAEWLKQLIKDGLIPDGEVDSRSIADVRPEDLKGFTQCHFFAGIGGWSRALQLAGWSSDRPVWTGSPPCQSFSTAGSRKGKDDERHLWPVFFDLIRECQPPTVFGEQVAAAIRFGWLDDLQNDFEAEGYASAAVVLPSGSIGAYHKRDRLFFTAKRVADSHNKRHERRSGDGRQAQRGSEHSGSVSMANSLGERPEGFCGSGEKRITEHSQVSNILADSCGERCGGKEWGGEAEEKGQSERHSSERSGDSSVGYSNSHRSQQGNEAAETAGHRDTSDSAVPWATPNTMDHMKQRSDEALARAKQKAGCSNLKDQIPYSGEAHKSSTAETESTAPSQLNPRFSLWLMGYPIEWAYSGERVTPLSRKRQQKS
jgi:DNA (cytosine-5)-methyltransferase 1